MEHPIIFAANQKTNEQTNKILSTQYCYEAKNKQNFPFVIRFSRHVYENIMIMGTWFFTTYKEIDVSVAHNKL